MSPAPERIEPALTPEEWRQVRAQEASDPDLPVTVAVVEGGRRWLADVPGPAFPLLRKKVAAVALQGYFSREQINALREAAIDVHRARHEHEPLYDVAGLLLALLPPEE